MVEYIKINGKNHPIRVSYYALKHTAKAQEEKVDLQELLNSGDMERWEDLLFYSLKAGARAADKEFSFKREDMEMILDECWIDFLEVIPKFFPKAGTAGGTTISSAARSNKKQAPKKRK